MPAPLIGITTTRSQTPSGLATHVIVEAYVDSIVQAGGSPVLIPLGLPESRLEEILARLDGVLFSGGGDCHPGAYGGNHHPRLSDVDEDRDRVEIHLLQSAVRSSLPFFGICRGLQVINVALGGTLYEDIADQRPGSLKHQYLQELPRSQTIHTVSVSPSSRLAQVLNATSAQVNSFHHQAIDRLAPGLQPTAFAPDGLIEGLELPDYTFGLAVQWHPEWLQTQPEMRSLFQSFVTAARRE